MQVKEICDLAKEALDALKAIDICVLDVQQLSSVMDYLIVASGTSNRHVKSLADNLLEQARQQNIKALGIEGEKEGQWVLVDLGDVVIHIMQPDIRAFYNLEKLWDRELVENDQSTPSQISK